MEHAWFAIVRDTPSSWEHYREIVDGLDDDVPLGLLIHVAGPTDEGIREIEVWRSRDELERHEQDRDDLGEHQGPRRLPAAVVRSFVVKRVLRSIDQQEES